MVGEAMGQASQYKTETTSEFTGLENLVLLFVCGPAALLVEGGKLQ